MRKVNEDSYGTITGLHIIHFIFLNTPFPSSPPSKAGFRLSIFRRLLRRGRSILATTSNPTEADGLEFAMLAGPHTQESHHTRASELKPPPEEVCGQRPSVKCCGNEVQEMDCEREVGDELRSGDE